MKCKKCGEEMKRIQSTLLEEGQGLIEVYICEKCKWGFKEKIYCGYLAEAHRRIKDGR